MVENNESNVSLLMELVQRFELRLDKFDNKIDTMQETINLMLRNYDKLERQIEDQSKESVRFRTDALPRLHTRVDKLEDRLHTLEDKPKDNMMSALRFGVTVGSSVLITGIVSALVTYFLSINR